MSYRAKGFLQVWEFPDATAAWIQTVRGSTFPLSGGGSTPTTTTKVTTPTSTTTTAPASTTTAASGSCSGVAAWVNNIAYVAGDEVTYNGSLWQAKQWTYGDVPGGTAGSWTQVKTC